MREKITECPDCGDNSCWYALDGGGMRTNGGCRCDKGDRMQVHSGQARPGWYYTREAIRLGHRSVRAHKQRIAALEARLAEAERDSARLDWLEETEAECALIDATNNPEDGRIWQVHADGSGFGDTLRAAIDAVQRGGKAPDA